MSKSSNSDLRKCNIVCSMLTEEEINIISSAYRKILVKVSIVLQPSPSEFNFMTMSSINMAKRQGDMTPPCLTPKTSLKKLDTQELHLMHVQDKSNQFSIIWSKFIRICQFINFTSKAWWFILSNAFERSSAQRLTVEPPQYIHQ